MPTTEKAQVIEQAKDWYSRSAGVVFTDYRGLKVKEMQDLRRKLRAKGGEIHVLKNTLFRLAAGDDVANFSDELHNGTTAIAFIYKNESECAKTLFDFAQSSKKLAIKGGYFSGRAMDFKQMEALSKLPPRDVLLAQLIGTIAAPLSNLVGVIEALYADPIRVIGAVADKVAESSPAPAPAPKAEESSANDDEALTALVEADGVQEIQDMVGVPQLAAAPADEPATAAEETPAVEEAPATEEEAPAAEAEVEAEAPTETPEEKE